MLNVKKTLTKIIDGFHGCDSSRIIDYGTASTITPTRNGWLRVSGETDQGQTIMPVLDIYADGESIGRGVGLTYAGSAVQSFAPVKAGKTYVIAPYRCTVIKSVLYY